MKFFKIVAVIFILNFTACQTSSDNESNSDSDPSTENTTSNDVYIQSNFTQIDDNQIEYENEIYFSSNSIESLDIESNESNFSKTYFGGKKDKFWIPESKVKEHTGRDFLTLSETVNDNNFTKHPNKLFYFKVFNTNLNSEPTSAKITLLTKIKHDSSNPFKFMYFSTTEDKNKDIQIFYNSALENHTFFLTVQLNQITKIYKVKFNKDSIGENITVLNIDLKIENLFDNIFDFSQNEPTTQTEPNNREHSTDPEQVIEPQESENNKYIFNQLENLKAELNSSNIDYEVLNFTQDEVNPIYESEIKEPLNGNEYIKYNSKFYIQLEADSIIPKPERYSEKVSIFTVDNFFRFKAKKVIYEPEVERIEYLIATKNNEDYEPVPEEKIESFLDVIYPNLDVKNDRKVISTDKTKFYYPDDENEQALIYLEDSEMSNYFVISHKTDDSINDENVDLDKYTKIGDYYYNIEPKNYNVNQVIFYGIPHIWEDRGLINGRSFHNLDDQKIDCSELNDQQCISFKYNWHCKYLSVTKLNLENSCLDVNYGKCVNFEDYLNLATSSNNKYGEYIAIKDTQTGDYFTTQNSDFIEELTNLTGENNYIETEEIKTELEQIIENSSSQDVTCDFSISEFQPTNF